MAERSSNGNCCCSHNLSNSMTEYEDETFRGFEEGFVCRLQSHYFRKFCKNV